MTRRFQFSLKALLVAISIAAGFFAWIGHNVNFVRQRQALIEKGRNLDTVISCREPWCGLDPGPQIPLVRSLLGDRPISMVFYNRDLDPQGEGLRQAKLYFPEATLINGTGRIVILEEDEALLAIPETH